MSQRFRIVGVPSPESADSPETRLFRVLQGVFDAYAGDTLPAPSARERMRQDMHAAVDSYHVRKISGAGPQPPRHTPIGRRK